MSSIYEVEDELLFFIRNNITEFSLEAFSSSLNKNLSETLSLLCEFSKKEKNKILVLYETKCPYCNKRVAEYDDFLSVGIGKLCCCKTCGEFIKTKKNTYLFFRINNKWAEAVIELDKKKLLNNNDKIQSKMISESHIVSQLNKVFSDLEDLSKDNLSIEGKILKSQIKTYLESKIK